MKKMALTLLLALLVPAASALGQNPQCNILRAMSPSEIGLTICQELPATPKKDDPVVIEAGGGQFDTKVEFSKPLTGIFAGQTELTLAIVEPAKAQENMLLLVGVETATIKIGSTSFAAAVQQGPNAQNISHYAWSVGPATKNNKDENTTPTSASSTAKTDNAFRMRFAGEYARGGVFGWQAQQNSKAKFQTTASLSIDTTDQNSPDFIDNNEVSLGAGLTNLSFGRLLMHGKLGIEAHLQKAFHQDVRNADAVVTASGWIPVLRSLTLLSQSDFIAAPLSFKASYGYRDRSQAGDSTRGRVFEGSANYNLFLLDHFQVIFNATLTHNDLDNQPASTPKTQRLYKGTIAYLENPNSGFKVLTTIEDGSAGVMLRKVRQYFIGIAISKLDLGSSGGN